MNQKTIVSNIGFAFAVWKVEVNLIKLLVMEIVLQFGSINLEANFVAQRFN